MNVVLRAGQIVQQELQQQGGAQAAALDLELGKAHGEINVPDIVHADEAGVLHGPGEAIAPGGVRGGAAVDGTLHAQVLPADGPVAGGPVPAAEGAALVAQKLRLIPQGLGQGAQLAEGPVQPEIRHHIAELRPLQLPAQQGKIRQHLGGGGDEVQPGIGPAQMVQQQVRVDDDSVLRAGAFRQQAAQPVAAGVRQVLRPQQGVAEGQPGGDAVFPGQGQHLPGVPVPGPHPAAAPDAVRRCAIQGGDAAPIVKILPVLPEQRQKHPVKIVKFKQARQMIAGGGCGHGETAPPLCGYPYCTTPPGKRQENSPRREC